MNVSVLIPAYNVEKYISQCLESVRNQTHHDLQIVVIDDGSKDKTFEIISQFADRDDRIEVISRENRGVAQTRNELLDHAIGNFVLFVDSDDWIEPDMIETLLSMTDQYDVELVMCSNASRHSSAEKSKDKDVIWHKEEILNKFLEHRIFTGSLWNKLIKRNLFDKIRFNPNIGYGEDAMVMWDIINRIDKMAYTPSEFYHYRMNDASISHQGLSESKMSVLRVWDYISSSRSTKESGLEVEARARYGAEVTLLLLQASKQTLQKKDVERVAILRNKLRELAPEVLRSQNLSYKFKTFSLAATVSWPLLRWVMSRFNIMRV